MVKLSPVPPQFQPTLVIPQDRPVYRIGEGNFFGPDDHLYTEGNVVAWDDEPNEEMEPLNDLARDKMIAYLAKLDAAGRKVAEKIGVGYTSKEDFFKNAQLLAKEDAKKVQLINGQPEVNLMGGKKRGRPRIEKIAGAQPAPLMGSAGKLSLGHKEA